MIIGISGPSGSGKTTIARALRQVYASQKQLCKSVQILHQDDFYKPEDAIPKIETRSGNVTNWDCPEAVEMDALVRTLESYRHHGEFPENVKDDLARRAKEDKNDTAKTGVSESLIQSLIEKGDLPRINDHLLIIDGFMLYQSPDILNSLDMAILLRGSRAVLKERREARSGYVTLEGFWKDPEGYFDDCVWPEYVRTHKQFFDQQNVEGSSRAQGKVSISDKVDMDLDNSFQFVIDVMS